MGNRPVAAVVLALSVSLGCGSLWNRLNQSGLEQDVRSLLAKHGFEPTLLECGLIGTTRDGYCFVTTEEGDWDVVVNGLRLEQVEESEFTAATGEHACRSHSTIFSAAQVRLFQSKRRAPELRLPDGGAFEFLVLYEDLTTGFACVEVSYAYG